MGWVSSSGSEFAPCMTHAYVVQWLIERMWPASWASSLSERRVKTAASSVSYLVSE